MRAAQACLLLLLRCCPEVLATKLLELSGHEGPSCHRASMALSLHGIATMHVVTFSEASNTEAKGPKKPPFLLDTVSATAAPGSTIGAASARLNSAVVSW